MSRNTLRNQTQRRLERELLTEMYRKYWVTLTQDEQDFPNRMGNVDALLTDQHAQKILCVVKKNATVLRRLLQWLQVANKGILNNCPTLIVDDEADQASVNASGSEDKRTKINELLLQILSILPKAAYVGYTATPFANVFIDPSVPEDLYPRDFIVDLPKPIGYFGAQQIFGREPLTQDEPEQEYDGLDMIRHIGEEEIPFLGPRGNKDRLTFVPKITSSLENALRYFWMATAARDVRGDADEHSTMLIHTSLYTAVHQLFYPHIEAYRQSFLKDLKTRNALLLEDLQSLWSQESSLVPSAKVGEKGTSFDELVPYLVNTVDKTKVVVENSRSDQRLIYGDSAKIQIVIGGNTLSRGLTLEGLVVSFFVRATSAYDTLLQMGRWFGYRPGYADLPRIWMTEELEGYFYDLATVEQEIRNDIKLYEDASLTPTQFGVRIRVHPTLSITSRLKMTAAIPCKVSYSATLQQTTHFKHKDKQWLTDNINAAKSLIRLMKERGINEEVARDKKTVFQGVTVNMILNFLNEYNIYESDPTFQGKLFRDYIQDQNKGGRLLQWNVVIVSRMPDADSETIDLGLGFSSPLLTRSRFIAGLTTDSVANLKAIASRVDRVADLDVGSEKLSSKGATDLHELRKKLNADDVGLLLIYPISKDSRPKNKENIKRGPLEAVEHLIGIAMLFPNVEEENLTPQSYMTTNLSGLIWEEEDLPEEGGASA
jgi:Z1 domain